MAGAKIGALHVALGIDTASFSAGLKKAQAGLSSFGKVAAVGFAAAATAAVAAGAALAVAGKRAIDTADNMSKAAQKVGVATEALSRLNYAAGYSDVSLEQLSGGMQKLSRNLADVASGKGGAAATALQALGISATDATGKLRGSDEVFTDIADRFGRMEDGSTKTALALQLFGRTGAEMIPLLNTGKDGLKRFADEADRTGNTISTKTGRAAEEFNDTLGDVSRILGGVALQVAEEALPALQDLADLLKSPEVASAAQTLGATMVTAFTAVVQAVATTTNAIKGFLDWLNGMGGPTPGNGAPLLNGLLPGEKLNLGDRIRGQSNQPTTAGELYSGFGMNADGTFKVAASAPTFSAPIFSAAAAKTAMVDLMAGIEDAKPKVEDFAKTISDSLASAFTGFADAVMSGVPAVEALSDMLGNLGKQLMNSAISSFFGNLFGGGFGGGFSMPGRMPGTANLLNVGSFAGGGYTGSGSRSGGMDGMGGFPAILHPNETVVDHSAGGGMGTINITINAPNSTKDAAPSIANEVRRVMKDYQKNPYRSGN